MQGKFKLLPMVQSYICLNMPSGGYKMVAKRLALLGIHTNNQSVLAEVRTIKRNTTVTIIAECIKFMKDNSVALDKYCEDFLLDQK